MDYALNVWMNAAKELAIAMLKRAQRVGAWAIIGVFKTVAVAIVEAEALIRLVHQRLGERATKLYIGIHTLPHTHPLKRLRTTASEIHVFTTENWTSTPANKGIEII